MTTSAYQDDDSPLRKTEMCSGSFNNPSMKLLVIRDAIPDTPDLIIHSLSCSFIQPDCLNDYVSISINVSTYIYICTTDSGTLYRPCPPDYHLVQSFRGYSSKHFPVASFIYTRFISSDLQFLVSFLRRPHEDSFLPTSRTRTTSYTVVSVCVIPLGDLTPSSVIA